ncbi:uncharacterized protein [Physcomitrium patens]|nr:blue copper protein-like [Physcomitrium patens]PNR27745.1 hypothetical protein PHYPA_029897 [Physcomitrium patens]|eukprot:XP_024365881.1 blue copper protein-like [Physcomitrella patens]
MAQGRSSAMAVLVIVAVLAFSQAVTAKDYNVGGTLNWDFPPGTDVGYYDTWSSQQKFVAGDSLTFTFDPRAHDVQIVTESEYTNCAMSSGKKYTSGKDAIPLTKPGKYYFICSFMGHCAMGMKMKVVVATGSSTPVTPPTSPATPPVTPPTASTPPPAVSSPPPAVSTPPLAVPTPPPAVPTPPPATVPAPVVAPVTPPVSAPVPPPVTSSPASTVAPVPAPAKAPTPPKEPSASPSPASSTPEPASAPVPNQSAAFLIRACLSSAGAAAIVSIGALLF